MDQHPFQSLRVPSTEEPLPQSMIDRWVIPLYMELLSGRPDEGSKVFDTLVGLWPDTTEEVVHTLLRTANWRPRIVGAYLAACKDLRGLTGWLGRLLLRSDMCYAGRAYCLTLAHFNTTESIDFLLEYLHYYLTRHDLWYDQTDAMTALAYLDSRNGSHHAAALMPKWQTFIADRPHWNQEAATAHFARNMTLLRSLSARMPA